MEKKSFYIISKKIEAQGYLLFHSYSGSLIFLNDETYEAFNNENFNKFNEDEILLLKKKFFIIDEYVNEYDIVANQFRKICLLKKNKLLYGTFIVTYDCNFNCTYCYQHENSDNISTKILTKSQVDKAFDYLNMLDKNHNKIWSITLYGGEPFLKENIKIVDYLLRKSKENKVKDIMAITNGYDLDLFDKYLNKDLISNLQITLDGTKEYHDKRRYLKNKEGTFEKIIENIEKYLKKNIYISVRCNTDNSNLDDIKNLEKFFIDKKYTKSKYFKYYFYPTFFNMNKDGNQNCIQIKHSDLFSYLTEKNISNNSIYYYMDKILKMLKTKNCYDFFDIGCGALFNSYVFDPLGDIYKCYDYVPDKNFSIGKYYPKFEVYTNNFNWDAMEVLKNINCKKCKYILLCGGGCKAMAFNEFNSLNYGHCNSIKESFDYALEKAFNKFFKKG